MNDTPMPPPEDDPDPATLRALLERLRRQPSSAVPSDAELARWLDGTLAPDEAARIEEIFLQHPELRRALMAARLGQPEEVPVAELDRLVALVPPSATRGAPVIPFPISPAAQRRHYFLAAAAAVALLVPAWSIGAKLARTRAELEAREMCQLVRLGMTQGGL
jgi:hypothetical protein